MKRSGPELDNKAWTYSEKDFAHLNIRFGQKFSILVCLYTTVNNTGRFHGMTND